MERIDKIISSQTLYSRKDVKDLLRSKRVKVNDKLVLKSDEKVDWTDTIEIDGEKIILQKNVYLILNKPKGYVSATTDNKDKTVIELVPEKYQHRELFPAGRLDKDTTGLMIITDDGAFAHNILSPKKHVSKKYFVEIDKPITIQMIQGFQEGVKLIDGECKPSIIEKITDKTCHVTLTEGRYHQIKRMFGMYHAKVIELKRISMGNLILPSDLKSGECRELTQEELKLIKEGE